MQVAHRLLAAMAAGALTLTLWTGPGTAEDAPAEEPGDPAAQARHTWQHDCRKCHAAPDARVETDRAFLAQIMETT